MRLIDADALQGIFNEVSTSLLCKKEFEKEVAHMVRAFLMTTEMIRDAPSVDAVQVVRCENCKHAETYKIGCYCTLHDDRVAENGFCSYGERKEIANDR